MDLFIFARFHAREDNVDAVAQAIREVIAPTRAEPGCLNVNGFHSTRDSQLFYIHSRWVSEEAFENHIGLPHTVHFIERVEALVDQPAEITRTEMIG
jgi:quinol monooxygenase YgiN